MEDNTVIATDTAVTDVSAPVSTPATDVSAPATPPAADAKAAEQPKTPAQPKSRHDTLREAFNKPANNRGRHAAYQPRADGKFAPGAPTIPAQADNAAPQRPAMIKSLKKELEPHWNSAPPELLQAFAQREADFEKGHQTWQSKVEQADSVLNLFKPYEWMLRNEGATPHTAIAPLLQTAAILRTGTPAQKAQAVANTMRQFGIPIEHISGVIQGQPQGALDPHYDQLAQQVQHLTQHFQTAQQAQDQRAISVIEQFASEPTHQHFAALQDKMLALLQTPQLLGQDTQYMSEREKLQLAYDTALRLDPTLSAQAMTQQQAEQQRMERERQQAAANAAKVAAVQVHGAPGTTTSAAVNVNDRRAVIANALRQVNA